MDTRVDDLRAKGDYRGAATELIRQCAPTILGYLRGILRTEEDVSEAFSQWCECTWRGMPSFEGQSSARTWAIRIACNVALNLKGRAHRRREQRLLSDEVSAIAAEFSTPSFVRVEREKRHVAELRLLLTQEEQTLLFLRVDQALPWKDVAFAFAEAGRPASRAALEKRFERLTDKLRRLARDQGLR